MHTFLSCQLHEFLKSLLINKSGVCETSMKLQELWIRRDEILHTAAKHGAYNVRVFGSTARDEANVESDVDFLVELEPG